MVRELPSRGWVPATWLGSVAVLIAACGGGGGGSPTNPPPPVVNPGSASFRLVTDGQDKVVSYTNGPNLVFCRLDAGFADLFIRFAEQAAADGESGPHLDIDLCNHGNGGVFAPRDPQVPSCDGGQTWGVFWHDDGSTFVNLANAPSCSLTLTRDGARLSGTFGCRGMTELGGVGSLDLLDGSFECVEE